MRRLHGITDSMGMSLSQLRGIVRDEEAWRAAVCGDSDMIERLNNNTSVKPSSQTVT